MEFFIIYLIGVIAMMIFMKYGDVNHVENGGEAFSFALFVTFGLLWWGAIVIFILSYFKTK